MVVELFIFFAKAGKTIKPNEPAAARNVQSGRDNKTYKTP
jgi:hypothetical protein